MNVNQIFQELKSERDHLTKAIDALEGISNNLPKAGRVGRPKERRPHPQNDAAGT